MENRIPATIRVLIVSVIAIVVSGCGSRGIEVYEVTGRVTASERPLASVSVEFQPEQPGSPSFGITNEQGEYRLRFSRKLWGAVPGQHTVRIVQDWEAGGDQPRPSFRIPAQFNEQSILRAEVRKTTNRHDFALDFDPAAHPWK